MVECQLKGLCYNYDDKYFQGHKCKEQNIFMAISEEISEEDEETPFVSESPESTDITPPSDPPEVEPVISLNALTGFSTPQTLKLIGYIKHRRSSFWLIVATPIILFITTFSQETHCYIHAINNFQIMIANGGSMKCGGHCENVCLQIGDYHLKSHMFSINMGGCDIVLGADWIRTLGPILMDFKELTMQFDQEGHQYKFQGITLVHLRSLVPIAWKSCSKRVILVLSPNSMPYKQQRHPRYHKTSKPSFLNINWSFPLPKASLLPMVFMIIPFPLYPKAFLPISCLYHHPFSQKNEIEKMVQELLNAGVIHPSTSPYSSPMVMVLKKEGSW
jgi:hypothetical protein